MTTWVQTSIFDAVAAEAAKEDGMARAADHAPGDWMSRATHALRECARRYHEFIVDDVWKLMDPADVPHEPRAMGPVMSWGKAAGIIEATGRFQPSDRKSAHRNPRSIWRSLEW